MPVHPRGNLLLIALGFVDLPYTASCLPLLETEYWNRWNMQGISYVVPVFKSDWYGWVVQKITLPKFLSNLFLVPKQHNTELCFEAVTQKGKPTSA